MNKQFLLLFLAVALIGAPLAYLYGPDALAFLAPEPDAKLERALKEAHTASIQMRSTIEALEDKEASLKQAIETKNAVVIEATMKAVSSVPASVEGPKPAGK